MRNRFHPFIPMLVHQVVNNDTAGFGQVRIEVCGALTIFHLRDEKNFFAIRWERESFYVSFKVGDDAAFRAVRIHFPNLAAATFIAQKCNLGSPFYPLGLSFVPRCSGKQGVVLSIGIHYINHPVAFVFRNTVICYSIGYLLAVGWYTQATYTSHCP